MSNNIQLKIFLILVVIIGGIAILQSRFGLFSIIVPGNDKNSATSTTSIVTNTEEIQNNSDRAWEKIRTYATTTVRFTNQDGTYDEVMLYIADDLTKKQEGLMWVNTIPENTGMLFIHETDVLDGFWMKNCYVPLDMIFINVDNEIVDIVKNAQPCNQEECPSYRSKEKYRYVIEVIGGWSEAHVQIGDTIELLTY